MIDFFKYGNIVSTIDENYNVINYRSICYSPKMPLKQYMLKTKILQTEKYRPDKVSFRLFNDPTMSWVIDEINSFYNFSDYYPNREIYYLDSNGLSFMGLETDYVSYQEDNF
jgi:hypothetical protein